jgi:epoxyqueuosine reductase
MTEKLNNYEMLKSFSEANGASLFGTADITGIRKDFPLLPENSLNTAVSIAFRLSKAVLDTIEDKPTQIYFHHYKQVNYFLDNLALRITNQIQQFGFNAMPIPASQVIDRDGQRGHLSHVRIARLAGLGHIGRNNLLVTPEFGACVRLTTILTDFPIALDEPLKNQDCGECRKCVSLCPAGAIKEKPEDFDRKACFKQLDMFRRKCQIGHHICGICVRACTGQENQ